MTDHRFGVRGIAAGCIAVVVLTLGGCGLDPGRLTLPSTSDVYTLHIELANALNLPTGAPVVANGTRIGRLDKVRVVNPSPRQPGKAIADVSIRDTVKLPRNASAQLRQDTILGDIYIALDTVSSPPAPPLEHGATIALSQSKPAVQVEDILAGIANFVSGGAIGSIEKTIREVNGALPGTPDETSYIANQLRANLIDLAEHDSTIGAFASSIDANTRVALAHSSILDVLLTPSGALELTEMANTLIRVISVIGAIGGIAHALQWLGPLVRSGSAAAQAFVPMLFNNQRALDLSAPSNLNRLVDFIRHDLIPWVQRPSVDVRGIRLTDSENRLSADDQTDRIIDSLRMIGFAR